MTRPGPCEGFVIGAGITLLALTLVHGCERAVAQPRALEAGDRGGALTGVADTQPVASLERALALAIAKVAVNEASLENIRPADVALIWQVTEGHGDDHASRLTWLRRHSHCTLGRVPPEMRARPPSAGSNCHWSWHLRDDDSQPIGWRSSIPWARYAERWADVRRTALALVQGRSHVPMPCEERPRTWGSPTLDHARALARGMRQVRCLNTHNEGWR